ncbi:MAG: polysaccharide deacetylase family protein [Mesorhizobium sp.]
MTLPDDYLRYEKRRHGMDHDRYDWSMAPRRKPIVWPNGARVALLVVPVLEWFPLDMSNKPFAPPGAMSTAYPDLRHYTLRDYGNRVGVYRLMDSLAERGVKATAAVNASVAQRYPALMKAIAAAGWEVMGHGIDMDHLHHGQLDDGTEAAWVARAVEVLQQATGSRPRGWMSPARSQSWNTLDLIAQNGIEYCCDWDNDQLPYRMRAQSGSLVSMPVAPDVDDYAILIHNHHSERSFTEQLVDHFDTLYAEAANGGRIVSIGLRPWVIGQPYRIGALEEALDHMLRHDGVWCATASEIMDAWTGQSQDTR